MEETGQLIKVLIHAFEDENFRTKADISPNPISLPVNPETFTQNFKVAVNMEQGQGNQGTKIEYKGTKPEELKLDFVLDGTETVEGYSYNSSDHSAKKQLEIFMEAVYNMNGEIHRPHFLCVQWGQFLFPGVVSNLDLNYKLFKPNGDPLRIKVSATFLNYVAQKERVEREGKESPDLTHERQVKAGDRLDLMTNKIYNKPKYVTQIARINGLTSFRKITPGAHLIFPSFDKNAE